MRYYQENIRFGFGRGITSAVKNLIIFNVSFYLVQEILKVDWFGIVGLTPAMVWSGHVYQLVTYMFLHGGFFHILFNMFVLWMFGSELERYWGTKEFLKYYFLTGIGAGICTALASPHSMTPTIGASGAVYGLLLAYGLTFPNAIIYLYFFLPIKAKYMVLIFGALEFFASLRPSGDMIAHIAHLGGMVFGLIYLRHYWFTRKFSMWWKEKQVERENHRRMKMMMEERLIRDEVDRLLDKINHIGLKNLSKKERRQLDKASRFLREREKV